MPIRKRASVLAIAGAFAAAATLGYVGAEHFPIAKAHAAAPATSAAQASRQLPDFSELVESQGPAVVNISTTTQRTAAGPRELPFKPGDPMYEFFRRFQIPMPDAQPTPRQGVGSGFI
ncbi:MAG: peptidase, partial [Burkholderiales bacterium]